LIRVHFVFFTPLMEEIAKRLALLEELSKIDRARLKVMLHDTPSMKKTVSEAKREARKRLLAANNDLEAGLAMIGETKTKKTTTTTSSDDECAICHEDLFVDGPEGAIDLSCDNGHVFHATCMALWKTQSLTCPTCRMAVL
jgi:hypothetical protein